MRRDLLYYSQLLLTLVGGSFLLQPTHGQAQSPYNTLIRQIQGEEVHFPFPQKDTMILIASIDARNPGPIVHYHLADSTIDSEHIPGWPESSADLGLRGPNRTIIVGEKYINDTTYPFNAGNHLHVTLRFNVQNW